MGCPAKRKNHVSIPERVWGGLEPSVQGSAISRSSVSIPERVWGGLELVAIAEPVPIEPVSIPERVWGGLELQCRVNPATPTLFQSLRGFGVGWSGKESNA